MNLGCSVLYSFCALQDWLVVLLIAQRMGKLLNMRGTQRWQPRCLSLNSDIKQGYLRTPLEVGQNDLQGSFPTPTILWPFKIHWKKTDAYLPRLIGPSHSDHRAFVYKNGSFHHLNSDLPMLSTLSSVPQRIDHIIKAMKSFWITIQVLPIEILLYFYSYHSSVLSHSAQRRIRQ